MAQRPCLTPRCKNLTAAKYCETCAPLHEEKQQRPSAARRGYDRWWQRESKAFLREHPWCMCLRHKGLPNSERATVVDHVVPHRGDMKLFRDRGNWQSLSKPCHDSWKRRLENEMGEAARPVSESFRGGRGADLGQQLPDPVRVSEGFLLV